jgi:hypothetical protein
VASSGNDVVVETFSSAQEVWRYNSHFHDYYGSPLKLLPRKSSNVKHG